ncbi:MAG: hypothetical protein JW903_09375 [Clostridia bacterium]|nr:hypothetical protein [Clostridia bacterium]
MELIKRYVYAVVKWLPAKKREDIGKELESSIYDALEANYGSKDEYTEAEVSAVIENMGTPWKVASGYTWMSDRLISPELLQIYFPLTLIISGAVCLGLVISFLVGIFIPDITFGRFILRFLELIPNLLAAVATVVGSTTIIFALIEHLVPGYKIKPQLEKQRKESSEHSGWSPRDLPPVPTKKQKVSLWEPIIGICFTIIIVALFNMFPEKIGIYYTPEWGSGWEFVPVFSYDALKTYLPYWNIVWAASLIFNIFLIIKLRWTLTLRIFDIAMPFMSIAVLGIMLNGPELVDMAKLLTYSKPDVADALIPVAEFFNYSIDKILIVLIVLTALGVLGKIVNIFKSDSYIREFSNMKQK